jgi:serine/threonine protein kinase
MTTKDGENTKNRIDNGNDAENNSNSAIENDDGVQQSNKTKFQIFGKNHISPKKDPDADFVTKTEEVDASKSSQSSMSLDAQMDLLCEKRRYENRGCINTTGGQGAIYRAYNPSLEEYYAVKLLYSSDEEARFISEALIMKKYERLGAKDICRIIDVQSRDGDIPPAIIMEFIEGMTLHKFRLIKFAKFTKEEQEVVSYRMLVSFMRIANDLALGHRDELWHRDLKPANIIVMNPDDPWRIRFKIVDFGIGKNPDKQLTVPLSVFGTPAYMSPEQFGKGEVDNSTDIYAMGLVLFFIVTGEEFYNDIISSSLQGMPRFHAIFDVMRGCDNEGKAVHSRQNRLAIVDENIRPIVRNATVFNAEQRYREMDLMVSAIGSQVDRLQRLNGFPTSETYYDIFESTGVRPMFDINSMVEATPISDEKTLDEEIVETPIPDEKSLDNEVVEPTSSFAWKGILILLIIMVGIFVFIKFRHDVLQKSESTEQPRHKTVKKTIKSSMQVVMRSVMQPDGSMKIMKVVVMKPEISNVKPVVAKPVVKKPVTPSVILSFDHFRKECSKVEWQARDLNAMLKCIMLNLPKMKDVLHKYDSYNQTYMHYCHPGLRRNLRAGKGICSNLENETLKVGYKAADAILKPIRAKCIGEKPKYYGENPSSLRVCMKNYAKSINSHFAQAALVASRLHFVFCKSGPVHKRASVKSCFWSKRDKIRLTNRLWKQRDAAIRKRLAESNAASK